MRFFYALARYIFHELILITRSVIAFHIWWTGVSPGEGTGATMSDDDDDQVDSDANLFDGSLEGADTMGFGPLIPTESERSLMERVRQELKHELKQVIVGTSL